MQRNVSFRPDFRIENGGTLTVSSSNPLVDSIWNTNMTLVEASAQDTQNLSVSWLPIDDGVTPGDQVVYEVHLSQNKDFFINASTKVHEQAGIQSASIGGLIPGTEYYVKMLARSNNGYQTSSVQIRITMPTALPQVKAGVNLVELSTDSIQSVTASTVLLNVGSDTPIVGDIIANDQSSFLREVTAVSANPDSTILLQTVPSSINQAFEAIQVSSSIALPAISQTSAPASLAFNQSGQPTRHTNKSGQSVVHWPTSGLTLMAPSTRPVTNAPVSLVRSMRAKNLAQSSNVNETLFSTSDDITETGNFLRIQAPEAVGIVPGHNGTLSLDLEIYKDDRSLFGNDILLTICEVTDLEVDAPGGKDASGLVTLGQLSFSEPTTITQGDRSWTRYRLATRPISIQATEAQISVQPYTVRVTAIVG